MSVCYSPFCRFFSSFEVQDDCWVWVKGANNSGYGLFYTSGKKIRAHRFAWELFFGPIPPGLSVLHRCDVPPCVNPDHLFLGTNYDNIQDMIRKGRATYHNALKTHCPKGHPYTEENCYYSPSTGGRSCLICKRKRRHSK